MAELDIQEHQAGEVIILDLAGKMTIGEGSTMLREAIHRLIEKDEKKILLNLAQVTLIDSSGIGALISCYATVNRVGGQIKLLNVTKRVRDLLSLTKLLTVFDVYEDELKALHDYR